ncbi:hypothetical protein HDU78_009509 [Chytriomyces hyalinus]|nr:hypothetical protein HDU78_009509 [Chytriomyces hyalinus]
MTKIYCTLSNDTDYTPFSIDISVTNATVKDLKKAICAVKVNDLAHTNLPSSGSSRQESFGKDPEDAEDKVSRSRGVPGACLVKEDSYCKVMKSTAKAGINF